MTSRVSHFSSGGILKRALLAGIVALSVASGSTAFAADDDSKVIFPSGTPKSETATMPKGGSLNSVTLFVGLALAGVGGWLVWRNRRNPAGGRLASALAVEETRPLGNRQYLVVASYEGKKFLLGVCPGQINMLAPLEEEADAGTPRE